MTSSSKLLMGSKVFWASKLKFMFNTTPSITKSSYGPSLPIISFGVQIKRLFLSSQMDVSHGYFIFKSFLTSPGPLSILSQRQNYLSAAAILRLRSEALEATCATGDGLSVKSLPSLSIFFSTIDCIYLTQ